MKTILLMFLCLLAHIDHCSGNCSADPTALSAKLGHKTVGRRTGAGLSQSKAGQKHVSCGTTAVC